VRNDKITVRRATRDDLADVVAFNHALARDTERKHLDRATLSAGVLWALQHSRCNPYFMAELDGRVVGQCMITYEWSDWENGWIWWFQSVYVMPEFRGRGVFRALFQHVQKLARERPDATSLRLYVMKDNTAARATYARLGMKPSGHEVYEMDFARSAKTRASESDVE